MTKAQKTEFQRLQTCLESFQKQLKVVAELEEQRGWLPGGREPIQSDEQRNKILNELRAITDKQEKLMLKLRD